MLWLFALAALALSGGDDAVGLPAEVRFTVAGYSFTWVRSGPYALSLWVTAGPAHIVQLDDYPTEAAARIGALAWVSAQAGVAPLEGEGMVPPVPEPVPPAEAELFTKPEAEPVVQMALGEGAELSQYVKPFTTDTWWIVTTTTTEYVPAAQQHMTIATWRAWGANKPVAGPPNNTGTAGSRLAAVADAMAWIDSLATAQAMG